jgi:hypothetical protein
VTPQNTAERLPSSDAAISGADTYTSGLRTGSTKPENLARLEKSRQWLKNYHQRRKQHETDQQVDSVGNSIGGVVDAAGTS